MIEYLHITSANVAEHGGTLEQMAALSNARQTQLWGEAAFLLDAPLMRADLLHPVNLEAEYFAAREGAQLLGFADLRFQLHANRDTLLLTIRPISEHSIGGAREADGVQGELLRLARARGRERGCTKVEMNSHHANASLIAPAALPPGAGSGASGRTVLGATAPDSTPGIAVPETSWQVAASDPEAQLCLRAGLKPGLMERSSMLRLSSEADADSELCQESEPPGSSGSEERQLPEGYDLVEYGQTTPPELLTPLAAMLSDFNEDNPSGEMEWERDDIQPERLAANDAAAAEMGMRFVRAVVVHRPTGEVAGFTSLMSMSAAPARLQQGLTMVARAHRGHGFGLMLKRANLERARTVFPEARVVCTENSDHNEHMLRINLALGFAQNGALVCWSGAL